MGYRKRYRRNGRRQTNRFRSIRKFGKFARRRQIIRRALSRRPRAPEIKWVEQFGSSSVAANSVSTVNFTQNTLNLGTEGNGRIGDEVFLRRFYGRLIIYDASTNTNAVDNLVRWVIWTPRTQYSQALLYMNGINTTTIPDHKMVTIHKDTILTIGNMTESPATPSVKEFIISMPFPRKVRFPNTNYTTTTAGSIMDPDKDVAYITLVSLRSPINYAYTCRTFFVDN